MLRPTAKATEQKYREPNPGGNSVAPHIDGCHDVRLRGRYRCTAVLRQARPPRPTMSRDQGRTDLPKIPDVRERRSAQIPTTQIAPNTQASPSHSGRRWLEAPDEGKHPQNFRC